MGEIRIVGPGKTHAYPYPVCKKEFSSTAKNGTNSISQIGNILSELVFYLCKLKLLSFQHCTDGLNLLYDSN